MAPQSTYRSFLGVAKEGTRYTPAAATNYIPIHSMTPQDIVMPLLDKGWRGSLVEDYGHQQGPIYSTFDFNGDVFADSIGWPLSALLGDVSTTGGGASPFSHVFAVKNTTDGQPTSMTLSDFDAINARQYAGWLCSELGFTFNGDGLMQYAAKGVSLGSITAATPVASFTAVQPAAAWAITSTVGASTVSTVVSGDVTIKRNVAPIHTADGTQAPKAIFSGAVTVDGKATFVMEDDSRLADFLASTQQVLDFTFSTGAGATAQQVKLHMSKAVITVGTINRGGDYVALDASFTGIANTTDATTTGTGYSPIRVTLQNALTGGTFA